MGRADDERATRLKIDTAGRDRERRFVRPLASSALALLLALVLFTPFVEMSDALSPEQRAYRPYGYGFLLVLQMASVLARGWQASVRILVTPVIGVIAWFCLSLLWAEPLELAGRRLALLCLIYLGIFGSVCDLGYRRSMAILRIMLVLVLVINLLVVFAFPEFGTQTWRQLELWRGIMAHKNFAGVLAAITIIVFTLDGAKIPVPVRASVIMLGAIFAYQSWSRTALISLLIAILVGLGIALMRPGTRTLLSEKRTKLTKAAWIAMAAILMIIVALTIQRDFLLSLTNDASAVTFRASIWRPMIQFYLNAPLLGSGYGAYWDAPVNLADASSYGTQKWLRRVDQGHNGYLDLLVQTGLPGFTLALIAALVWPLSRFAKMNELVSQRAALIFGLITFVILQNFAESTLFADDAIANAMLLVALAQIRRFELRSEPRMSRATSVMT